MYKDEILVMLKMLDYKYKIKYNYILIYINGKKEIDEFMKKVINKFYLTYYYTYIYDEIFIKHLLESGGEKFHKYEFNKFVHAIYIYV